MATSGNQLVPANPSTEGGATTGDGATTGGGETASSQEETAKRKREDSSRTRNSSCRSNVWEHFEKFDEPLTSSEQDGKEDVVGHCSKARCKYCDTVFKANSSFNGTSTLRRHIENVCKKYPGRLDLEEGQKVLTSDGSTNSVVMRQWSPEACTEACVVMIVLVMIVMDELPFSQVEKEGFKYFCSVSIPRWEIPSRRVIVKKFLAMYDAKKEELRAELCKHRVCLTTDTWTSIQNVNYMVVTAHFIDGGWNLHKMILNFCCIPNHSGVAIGKILETCLVQWKIDKVLTISVDNATANKHAVEYVRKKMLNWTSPPVLGGKHLHVRCLAHILNLVVRSGLSIMDKSVDSIRNAVRYVRSSSSRLDEFKLCVEKEILDTNKVCILDVPTRWNSTFLMLDTAIALKKAFVRLGEENVHQYNGYFDEEDVIDEDLEVVEEVKSKTRKKRVGPPNDDDWERAAIFCQFLRVFYDVTLSISATLKPTAHSAFHDIVAIEGEIDGLWQPGMAYENETAALMGQMAVRMKNKFQKYFGNIDDVNQLLLVALVLDPRYKLRNFTHICKTELGMDDGEAKEREAKVKDLLVALTDTYAASMNSASNQNQKENVTNGSRHSGTRGASGKMAAMMDNWAKELENSDEIVVECEVDRYIIDPFERPKVGESFEILTWWKHSGSKYPNLQCASHSSLHSSFRVML